MNELTQRLTDFALTLRLIGLHTQEFQRMNTVRIWAKDRTMCDQEMAELLDLMNQFGPFKVLGKSTGNSWIIMVL